MVERDEVVDRRRPHARPLRREHPVAEVEDVHVAEEALGRRAAERAPRSPERVREREPPGPELDVDALEGRADSIGPVEARRGERDDLVLGARDLDEAAERAADEVPDPEQRVRERGDVERDPHGASGA